MYIALAVGFTLCFSTLAINALLDPASVNPAGLYVVANIVTVALVALSHRLHASY